MKFVEWDEKTPVYSDTFDVWFEDMDAVNDHVAAHRDGDDDSEATLAELDALQLYMCYPNLAQNINVDYWEDDIGEDGPPDFLEEAVKRINAIIAELPPLSYTVDFTQKVDLSKYQPTPAPPETT
jgi:hypothetical protein